MGCGELGWGFMGEPTEPGPLPIDPLGLGWLGLPGGLGTPWGPPMLGGPLGPPGPHPWGGTPPWAPGGGPAGLGIDDLALLFVFGPLFGIMFWNLIRCCCCCMSLELICGGI